MQPNRFLIASLRASLVSVGISLLVGCGSLVEDQASAQSSPAADAPVVAEIARISKSASGRTTATVEMSNRSSKIILGYVLKTNLQNPKGQILSRMASVRFHPPHLPHLTHNYQSGSTWQVEVQLPVPEDGTVVTPSVEVDFVLNEDRSSWGPDSLGEGKKLAGVVDGYKMERVRLRRLLEKEGIAAVEEDLKQ